MTNPYLLLWLESPLQSWGTDSKFGRRDTMNFPTKSGILGLLCCALGASGEQREFLERMATLSQTALSFSRMKNGKICEREPLLNDFHMVGSGYDDNNPWENLLIPKTSKNGKATGGGTKLTYRYYLQDSAFAVVLEIPKDLSTNISDALKDPVWDLYLGRKSCAPTDIIFRGLFISEDEAIENALNIAKEKSLSEEFRVLDGRHGGEEFILQDVPVQFGDKKQYRDRYVTVVPS